MEPRSATWNRRTAWSARRLRAARIMRAEVAVATPEPTTQNITVRLDRRTLRKAKILAAKRNTSISGLLAEQIETLVGEDDAYEQAQRRALALLDQGFHLGGRIESTRDEWHER
jgi:hypothetical protein